LNILVDDLAKDAKARGIEFEPPNDHRFDAPKVDESLKNWQTLLDKYRE